MPTTFPCRNLEDDGMCLDVLHQQGSLCCWVPSLWPREYCVQPPFSTPPSSRADSGRQCRFSTARRSAALLTDSRKTSTLLTPSCPGVFTPGLFALSVSWEPLRLSATARQCFSLSFCQWVSYITLSRYSFHSDVTFVWCLFSPFFQSCWSCLPLFTFVLKYFVTLFWACLLFSVFCGQNE